MPRRQPLIALALAFTALSACGRSVSVEEPPAQPGCSALVAAMPDRVAGQAQRETTASGTTAWGDPPITLRCGVDEPAAYSPTRQLLDVDGIAWLTETTTDGTRFTSVRTTPRIEVSIPAAQDVASQALVDITAALTALAQSGSAP